MVVFFVCSCKKTDEDIASICFEGKFIGNGCWSVIQILSPLDERFKNSKWIGNTIQYNYAVGIGSLPEKYKNGKSFYFTISKIDSNFIYTTNCNIPKYTIDIKAYSDSACKIPNN